MKKVYSLLAMATVALAASAQVDYDALKAAAVTEIEEGYTYTLLSFNANLFAQVTNAENETTGAFVESTEDATHFTIELADEEAGTYYIYDGDKGLYLDANFDSYDVENAGKALWNSYVTLAGGPSTHAQWILRVDPTRTGVVTFAPAALAGTENPSSMNRGADGICLYQANEGGNPKSWWYLNAWDGEDLVTPGASYETVEATYDNVKAYGATEITDDGFSYVMLSFNANLYAQVTNAENETTGAFVESFEDATKFTVELADEEAGTYYIYDGDKGLYLDANFDSYDVENAGQALWNQYVTLAGGPSTHAQWCLRVDPTRSHVVTFTPAALGAVANPASMNRGADGICLYQANEGGNPKSWWYLGAVDEDQIVVPSGIHETVINKSESKNIYDLSGRKLNKAQKGINIINGKKVFIK